MYGDGMQIRDWLHVARPRGGDRVRAPPRRVGRGLQPGRRERAAEPRGHRPAARGHRPRLVARPLRARIGPGTTAATRWTARRRRRSAGGPTVRVRATACPRPSPGTATTPTGSRAARSRRLGRLLRAPVRRPARGGARGGRGRLTDAGRGHRRPRPAGPGADRGARGRAVHRDRGPDRRGRARTSTSTRSRWSRVSRADRARPARDRHPRRGLDRRRRLRPRPRPRACGGTARRDGVARRRPAPTAGSQLVLVSTNEVFDGERTRRPRLRPPDDPRRAINAYGAEQARGRERSPRTRPRRVPRLAIARTSWLHGPPGNDFPEKIARAALRARDAGEPLSVVGRRDRHARPTRPTSPTRSSSCIGRTRCSTTRGMATIHHLVNGGRASRADWAREVLRATSIEVDDRGGSRLAPGSAPAPRPCGPSSSPRRSRRASRCATGGSRSRTRSRPSGGGSREPAETAGLDLKRHCNPIST